MTTRENLDGLRGLIYHALNTLDELIEQQPEDDPGPAAKPIKEVEKIDSARWYSQQEAADFIGVSSSTVKGYGDKKMIRYNQAHEKAFRKYLGADIISFIKHQK